MLFEDLTWMDVESYLDYEDRVVLVVGACEQHAYLSLLTDVSIPMVIAREACQREGILIAPPVAYGISPQFSAYPGTISLRPQTFVAVVTQVLEALLSHGFRRILVSNGHGGNTGLLQAALVNLSNMYSDVRLDLFEYWRAREVQRVIEEEQLPPHHANWSERFPFTSTGPVPHTPKDPVQVPRASSATTVRDLLGDGSFGGPYKAPERVMERFFGAAVEAMRTALTRL